MAISRAEALSVPGLDARQKETIDRLYDQGHTLDSIEGGAVAVTAWIDATETAIAKLPRQKSAERASLTEVNEVLQSGSLTTDAARALNTVHLLSKMTPSQRQLVFSRCVDTLVSAEVNQLQNGTCDLEQLNRLVSDPARAEEADALVAAIKDVWTSGKSDRINLLHSFFREYHEGGGVRGALIHEAEAGQMLAIESDFRRALAHPDVVSAFAGLQRNTTHPLALELQVSENSGPEADQPYTVRLLLINQPDGSSSRECLGDLEIPEAMLKPTSAALLTAFAHIDVKSLNPFPVDSAIDAGEIRFAREVLGDRQYWDVSVGQREVGSFHFDGRRLWGCIDLKVSKAAGLACPEGYGNRFGEQWTRTFTIEAAGESETYMLARGAGKLISALLGAGEDCFAAMSEDEVLELVREQTVPSRSGSSMDRDSRVDHEAGDSPSSAGSWGSAGSDAGPTAPTNRNVGYNEWHTRKLMDPMGHAAAKFHDPMGHMLNSALFDD